ncbi:MAG: Gfo/Idh/MocA family oxidoreductase [Planctomycetia bacterium]|nr:Gfo/Idh/MocA family oxidoreductase [Planctomycetia bacterium]
MIRIGIVGCGRILAAHLRGYRLLREAGIADFQITALCSRKLDDAQMYVRRGAGPRQRPAVSNLAGDPLAIGDEFLSDFQPEVEVATYTDYRDMIASGRIDAVNDFSTHALHHQIAAVAFAHGKHLMSQKPLAITVAAARRMCEEAERRGLTFGVFENFRYAPATRHLRWAFESGLAGKLQMFLLGYAGVWWAPDLIVADTPWRHLKSEAGGISLDLGVHFFDQLRYVAGEIKSVSARTSVLEPLRYTRDAAGRTIREQACDADDTFTAHLETAGGALGSMFASWAGHGGATRVEQGAVYQGSRGRISAGDFSADGQATVKLAELYRASAPAALQASHFPLGIDDSFALAQLDWLRAVGAGRQPETDGREGLRDLAAAFALLESATTGTAVSPADVAEGRIREFQRPLDAQWGLQSY